MAVDGGRLIERSEGDVGGSASVVAERAFERVQIVRADGDQCSLAANVVMQLVLEVDEALVVLLRERHVAQDGADHERSHRSRLFIKTNAKRELPSCTT